MRSTVILILILAARMAADPLDAQENAHLKIGRGTLDIVFDGMPNPALRTLVLDWTTRAAHAVT
ncbi:MAG TPA: hypothetical protein VH598_05490, partial [Verrucomicrobiae bacterium]|nr:hypothetical protein [Verrucomicrobiae bacterium]